MLAIAVLGIVVNILLIRGNLITFIKIISKGVSNIRALYVVDLFMYRENKIRNCEYEFILKVSGTLLFQ